MRNTIRLMTALATLLVGTAWAAAQGTITITSPSEGAFLGLTNKLRFNISGGNGEVEVRAVLVADSGGRIELPTQRFFPDVEGKVNSAEIDIRLLEGTASGRYQLRVTATDLDNNVTYNTPTPINVTVDVDRPEFIEFQPLNESYVRGQVPIRVRMKEANVKEWRVQVDEQDIPNNSGTSGTDFTVIWDSDTAISDGEKAIKIRMEDQAGNGGSRIIQVTIDRRRPISTVLTPSDNTGIRARATLPVAIDFFDQFPGSLDVTGLDVMLMTLDNRFIQRVARRGVRQANNVLQWTGRIRWQRNFPDSFKMVVRATDKAGNTAIQQEVVINVSGRGRR